MNIRIKSTSRHQLQEDEIVTKLKETIDACFLNTQRLNELILDAYPDNARIQYYLIT
jgi:hypothetical protein